jgi:hypothetical protein
MKVGTGYKGIMESVTIMLPPANYQLRLIPHLLAEDTGHTHGLSTDRQNVSYHISAFLLQLRLSCTYVYGSGLQLSPWTKMLAIITRMATIEQNY